MSNLSIRMRIEPIRSIAFGGISGTYAAVGTSLAHPIHIMHFTNSMDAALFLSFDGVVDHIVLMPGGYFVLDITSNKSNAEGLFATTGTVIYAKKVSASPTSGSLYISTFYASSN